jgi:hypothetical protein
VIDETQVFLVSRVVLQPRSETFVQASVGDLQESQRRSIVDCRTTVLFETTQKSTKKRNVHTARGVMEIDSCTDTIPVKIINTSNAPITLHSGSVVGVLESVEQSQLIEVNSVSEQSDELDLSLNDKFDNCDSVVGIEDVDLSHINDINQHDFITSTTNSI